jgi:hypothetical protein
MDEVVTSDCDYVAISRKNNYIQLGISQLQSGSERERSTVGCMKGIQLDITSSPAGAAYS